MANLVDDHSIELAEAEDDDMPQLFTIASRAFAGNEPYWDAVFPRNTTEQGQRAGGEVFLNTKQNSMLLHAKRCLLIMIDAAHFIKAVDTAKNEIVGFTCWYLYKSADVPSQKELTQGSLYQTKDEAEYAAAMMSSFYQTRHAELRAAKGSLVCLDICAVDPNHQKKGIGGKLVDWGVQKATEMGVDAVVESSIQGRGLYQKHGFIFVREVEVDAGDHFSDHPKASFDWMIRRRN